jgi:hypothetical protein
MNELSDETKIEICRGDFFLMLEKAIIQCGGSPKVDSMRLLTLHEVVNTLAHNGIRMIYMPEKHMDSVSVSWESPGKKIEFLPSGRREDGPLPKRRQLLCDQADNDEHPDEDYDTNK